MTDFSQCNLPPYAHQVVGIEKLLSDPYVFLADEMGTGKGLQVIVAAQLLFQQDVIDTMIVIAPSCVKSVWMDATLGELKKHLFDSTPATVVDFHSRTRAWKQGPEAERRLYAWISNYEFVIAKQRLTELEDVCGPKTLLVLDESAYIKSHSSKRTLACKHLRKLCGRIVLLNGTPIANSPLDLFSQANILHHQIIDCPFITLFKARYATESPVLERGKPMVRHGKLVKSVTGWRNLDDLSQRLAPYMLRRLKSDMPDLPPKLPPVTITVEMTPTTWTHYKTMRDELVIWLQQDNVAVAKNAAVKIMRLAQITSGFVGGIEESSVGSLDEDLWDLTGVESNTKPAPHQPLLDVQEIGREKLDAFLEWLALRLDEDPSLKLLVQCRFRPEIARLTKELRKLYPKTDVGEIVGGQKKQERTDALRLLDPRTMPRGPAIVTMSSAGSLGLNLTGAHTVARLSRDFSLWIWLQGEDRVHRPGQTSPVSYADFVARGPRGQKTVDHIVLEALMVKQDVATQTAASWITALKEE